MKSIKILSIDGGGIRGIIPAIILAELQKRLGALHNIFDLISGTSTGGIIALGLGTRCNNGQPYSPDELVSLYVQNGATIFKKSIFFLLKNALGPKYSPDGLEATLGKFFGAAEFSTALTPLLISSYDLQGQLPFFFKSHRIAANPNYNWPCVSIARATSAAPTFFPPLHLVRGTADYDLVDGGVFVNNPSMAAYAEARYLYGANAEAGAPFIIVSVGTGDRQDRIAYSSARKWGLLGWAKQIVPVFMDSVSEAVDYELQNMPGCSYSRFQVENLPQDANDMDNVAPENLANLQSIARAYVASQSAALDALCAKLSEGRGSNIPGTGVIPS